MKIMGNNEDQGESSKGNREIITPGVDLENDIIKKNKKIHLRSLNDE